MNIGIQYATTIAEEIKAKIKEVTQLTASAGISYNKFLAKIASDYNKPDGLFVITPKMAESFIASFPIAKFNGIGKVTANRMQNMGIHTGNDLKALSLEKLVREFGKVGAHYYKIARGIDERPVNATRVRKSVGSENTYSNDLQALDEIFFHITEQMDEVWQWCQNNLIFGRTVTVKIKYNDFSIGTRSKTTLTPILNEKVYKDIVLQLIKECYLVNTPVRLLGVSVSNLSDFKINYGRQLQFDFP